MNISSIVLPLRVSSRAMTALVAGFVLCLSVQAQNMCDTQASLVNPAALAPGIGGTGAPRNDVISGNSGGVGGTGAPRDSVVAGRPGIGGTGITGVTNAGVDGIGGMGGTGIVGVITGFASICINGLEVQYDASTPVIADGLGATTRELAVGQVVAVRASGAGAQLMASNIALIHAVVGPVSRVDTSTGQIELLGQAVRADNLGELSNLRPGQWVQVSGYRLASGEVAASRIERIAAREQAQIIGQLGQVDAFGFTLYGTRVSLANLTLPSGAVTGSEVLVRGSWDGSSLTALSIEIDPTRQGMGRVGNVVLEGYVHALAGREISLGNNVMTLAPNVQIFGSSSSSSGSPLAVDQRVQVSGQVSADQRITVNRIQVKGGGSGSGGAQSGLGISSDNSGNTSSDSSSSGKSSGKGSSDGSSNSGKGSSDGSSNSGKGSSDGSSNSGKGSSDGSSNSGKGSSSSSGGSSGSSSGSGSGSSGSSGSSGGNGGRGGGSDSGGGKGR